MECVGEGKIAMVADVDKKKQNILIVHNYYQIPGGEDTVVANEKKMLEKHGHKVILYSRNNSELNKMPRWKKLGLPFTTIFNLRTYREVKRLIKMEHIDIVHVHNTLNLVSPSVYYAARVMKIPVVQTIHNFRLLCPGATFYRDGHICEDCVKKGLMCAVGHNCYRNSKVQTLACVINTKIHRMTGIYEKINYICLTTFNKEKLLQLKRIKADRIFVKPNFVEVVTDKIIPCDKRENQFIFAGRLDKLKGIDILYKAWKQMGATAPKLVICGIGPLEKWCKKYLIDYPNSNIEMRGLISNIEARRLIANSKALILPTQWYEGFPMSIVEAFSVGTPVIVSNLGNAGSLVVEGITGAKFKPDSQDALIQAVKRLSRYPNICQTTFEQYKKLYTETSNYMTLIKIYQSLN